MPLERIDKIVSNQCNITRSEVKKLLKKGQVVANGQVVKDAKTKFDTDTVKVVVEGRSIEYKKHIYLMLNKPKGVVSATNDKSLKTVVDLVPDEFKRDGLFPAGRLDFDTTGFVLITDDGEFAHRILSPKRHVDKTYVATLEKPIDDESIQRLEKGIVLKDGTQCLRCKAKIISTSPKTVVEIVIHEGKYHQVKRMFAATGNKVIELNRTKIGNLELDKNLELSDVREINEEELKLIY